MLLKNDKSDPVAYSIIFQLLTGILIGIYAVFNGFKTPSLIPILPNLVLMTFLYGAGNVFIFKALKMVDATEFTIIFASRALWTIFGAILILNESFSIQQALGTILIILSVILVSLKGNKFSLNKGLLYPSLAALFFGLGFVNDALIIDGFSVPSYLTIAFILPSLSVWVVYPKSTAKMKPMFERSIFLKVVLLGIVYAVSAITFFLSYQVGKNAGQIATINQTTTIITAILSVIILKERNNLLKKLIGAIISFIGVVLVK